MCGRFTQHYSWAEVHAFLNVFGTPQNLQPRYNIALTTEIDVVRNGEKGRELLKMRWGLVPLWWRKPLRALPATFNARSETVHEKPMFRGAFKSRRCIIPASGFYEWTGPQHDKTPHLFTAADASPVLAFAGLWEHYREPESGEVKLSCTIIVSGASEWMAPYHDRMPVLLGPDQFNAWLDAKLPATELRPAPEEALRERVVSIRVNRAGADDDDPTLVNEVWPFPGSSIVQDPGQDIEQL